MINTEMEGRERERVKEREKCVREGACYVKYERERERDGERETEREREGRERDGESETGGGEGERRERGGKRECMEVSV